MAYERYVASPYTVAYTTRPATKTGARHKGGLCLLGSTRVRRRLGRQAVVTPDAITLTVAGVTVAGVYLPPSMPERETEAVLDSVARADVVLGDLNVRYSLTLTTTPRDRGTTIERWAYANGMRRLNPAAGPAPVAGVDVEGALTVDHCFVGRAHVRDPLYLLANGDLGLATDHRYTMLVMAEVTDDGGRPAPEAALPRYSVGKVCTPATAAALRERWATLSEGVDRLYAGTDDPERLDAALVEGIQRTCAGALGVAVRTTKGGPRRADGEVSYHRLVRQVFELDEDNGPLYSGTDGLTALEEAAQVLGERYRARGTPLREEGPEGREGDGWTWSAEDVREGIGAQDGSKACGGDGVHMRVLKALQHTSLPEYLAALFNACVARGTTPRRWNETEIHLLVKDRTKAKTVGNARPITLIVMFRKLFESLLLEHLGKLDCLQLHPAQAGFRAGYSTLTLAATVHVAMEQRRCAGALFLDFRAAFDTVDQDILRRVLLGRGCPARCVALLTSLNAGVVSRVMANGGASTWIPRGRGVLQGSPLSPLLWNVVADDLIRGLNAEPAGMPRAVFYADDGALLYRDETEIGPMLGRVGEWCDRNGIAVNAAKCGHVTWRAEPGPVWWGEERIPQVDEYRYLGFPVTPSGIDFLAHLSRRLDRATGRARFMAGHSGTWGVGNRLRVYQQYLAPIIEYGAPLVWAALARDATRWSAMEARWRTLIQWIAHGEHGWRISQNLLGVPTLPDRFECRHAAFLRDLERADVRNPLRALVYSPGWKGTFVKAIRESKVLRKWKATAAEGEWTKAGFKRFARGWVRRRLMVQARRAHLTSIIPWQTRLRGGPTIRG
ncbi:hypothetical protein KC316_g9604 [Hortaea werneckii]|nr:hypothetical protein KC316_g9604 [Hortaea werneckii]